MYKKNWWEYIFRCDWCFVSKLSKTTNSLERALYYIQAYHNWRVMDNKEYNKQNEYCNNCYKRIIRTDHDELMESVNSIWTELNDIDTNNDMF